MVGRRREGRETGKVEEAGLAEVICPLQAEALGSTKAMQVTQLGLRLTTSISNSQGPQRKGITLVPREKEGGSIDCAAPDTLRVASAQPVGNTSPKECL